MSTYSPAEGVWVARPPCANCGANWHLHHNRETAAPTCPEAYRPQVLAEAQAALERATAAGDEAAVFVARGNLQRLQGRPARPDWPVDHEEGE